MTGSPLPRRLIAAALVLAVTIAIVAALGDRAPTTLVLAVAAALSLLANVALLSRLAPAGQEQAAPISADAPDEDTLALLHRRLSPTHPVTGLPVREALLAQMNADQRGLLGAIAFADFERLTAFDPALGEKVFASVTARLCAMLPADRFVAQVDRGQIVLWFGDAIGEGEARAELESISYALQDKIEADEAVITPQVNVRLAPFDAADGMTPAAFLARTLASFTLAAGMAATDPAADLSALARDRYVLEQDLRDAIAQRQFRLAFQPLVDAAAGRVTGAEALIRWTHPQRGEIAPARFIPIVEAMGLASEVGMWALNAAARQAAEWRAGGLGHLRVAVNVSGLQLERDDLPVLVQRTLARHDLGAGALEIELTESVATSDAAHCRRIFQQLQAIGVKLAVDDFGTGYSGFSSLRALAFDKIKIDREFITDVDRRPGSQAICHAIVALGRGLGIRVLAEGVERRQEYEWLRRHGCAHFQGYYFGRPMDGAALAAFARDRAALGALLAIGTPQQIEARLRA